MSTEPATGKLNKTEKEILQKIKEGLTSGQIAAQRGCSARTVEKHRSNMIKKLGINSSQNALVLWAMQNHQLFNT
ncbi:MAG: helix-turn-helix transcriptional regulator [Bacteroidetes bacterium]|nr:helix-turn-helix transcriptional regulator [Bacteroidota bacterium]